MKSDLAKQLNIRRAQLSDVDLIFELSNDALSREQSFNSAAIVYESHCDWFKNKLKDESCFAYIIEFENEVVSFVRIEINCHDAVIGIVINKKFRGKGLGSACIRIGLAEYFNAHDFPVLAFIKNQNMASIKAFEKAGFCFLRNEKINEIDSAVYKINKKDF